MRDALPNTTYVAERQKAKAKWTTLESIVGNVNRIQNLAKDIVNHFEQRQKVFEGKVMIVAMSRRIAADLYKQITALRPEWHDDDFNKGVIKVVMTSSSADKIAFDAEHPTANAPNQGTFARPTKPTPHCRKSFPAPAPASMIGV